jgi:hypothetical protein
MLEFDTGVRCGELPVGLGVGDISIILPSRDFVDEGLFVGNAAIEALEEDSGEAEGSIRIVLRVERWLI